VTLLTTLLDFSDTGILDLFIDEGMVAYRELQMGQGGLLPGGELASTFSFLRPNDLVWNYVVGNYLKGETPPPFDLLYWNSDATNLPGPFYAWYLRNTYLENRLIEPGKAVVCGEKIDLNKVDAPAYIYGSREDHIVPINAAYASTQVLQGKKRFVMGASGHIAGVINPPAKKKRSHWTSTSAKFPADIQDWLAGAQPSTPAAGGPTGPTGSRATLASKLLLLPRLWQGQVQGHRARTRPLRQGQSLNHRQESRDLTTPSV
jgi:polyhydroxyalkanoate synthase